MCPLFYSQKPFGVEFRALEFVVVVAARTYRMGYTQGYRAIVVECWSVDGRRSESTKTIGKCVVAEISEVMLHASSVEIL